jgi:hypothetical protein
MSFVRLYGLYDAFEHTLVTIKTTVYRNVTPCSLVDVSQENTASVFRVQRYSKQEMCSDEATSVMEVVRSSETSVSYWTRRPYILEGSTFIHL